MIFEETTIISVKIITCLFIENYAQSDKIYYIGYYEYKQQQK